MPSTGFDFDASLRAVRRATIDGTAFGACPSPASSGSRLALCCVRPADCKAQCMYMYKLTIVRCRASRYGAHASHAHGER